MWTKNFRQWLAEMPIAVNMVGNWQDAKDRVATKQGNKTTAQRWGSKEYMPGVHRWPSGSINLLTNPTAQNKIVQRWAKVPEDFVANMVITPLADKSQGRQLINFNPGDRYGLPEPVSLPYTDQGEVDEGYIRNKLGVSEQEAPIYPNKINLFFLRNDGGNNIDMNAWTIAHRFGHMICLKPHYTSGRYIQGEEPTMGEKISRSIQDDFMKYLSFYSIGRDALFNSRHDALNDREFYRALEGAPVFLELANKLLTMRSARLGRITNWTDVTSELLSQYIFSRKVTLNPLPPTLRMGGATYSLDPQYEGMKPPTQRLEQDLQRVLDASKGKIFVM